MGAKVLDFDRFRQLDALHQFGGNQHLFAQRLAQGFQPRGGVYRIAEKGDLVMIDTDFGGDDEAAVQGGPKPGNLTEILAPRRRILVDLLENIEDAAHAARKFDAAFQRPRDDRRIADIVVNRTLMAPDRFSECGKQGFQVFLRAQVAMPFGKSRQNRRGR